MLYNCARLSAIQQQFEDKVKTGYYPPLIPFDQVDFALLSREVSDVELSDTYTPLDAS